MEQSSQKSAQRADASTSAKTRELLNGPAKFLVLAAAFVIVIAGMKAAASIIVPLLLAIFLAIICAPALFWMAQKKISTLPAILLISLLILVVGALTGSLLTVSIADFTKTLPAYAQKLDENFNVLLAWLQTHGLQIEKPITEYIKPDAKVLVRVTQELLAQVGVLLKNGFLIYLITVFILMEMSVLPAKIKEAAESNETFEDLSRIANSVKHYLALKTAISLVTGLLAVLLLVALKVDYAAVWGLLVFLLNFVPNIGSILAAVPPVLLAMLQHGFGTAAIVAAGYLFINISIGSFLEPRLMGRQMGLSALVVFLSLIFWGWVLGPVGMLLSVPLTMAVKVALQANKDTHSIAVLLGSKSPEPDTRPAGKPKKPSGKN